MKAAALAEPSEDSPRRRITDWLTSRANKPPSAKPVRSLNFGGPRLAYHLAQIAQAFGRPSRVVAGKGVAATSTQSQKPNPIEAMPVELFQAMMWEILRAPLVSRDNWQYYHALTQLRLVCRQWTRILEEMPRIWSYISLIMGNRLVGLALSRSGHSPLTITGHLSSSPGLDKLLQHAYRWEVLDVTVEGIDTMDRLASLSVPLLAELRVSPPISDSPLQTILFNGSAPMLRIACILDCAVGWSTPLFSNLQELVLDLMEGAGGPDVDTFLKLLSQSPKLTRLEVQNTLRADEHPLQPRVSLPCLQSLTLEHLEKTALTQVLNAIDIPTSTECLFSLDTDLHSPRHLDYERLKPIDRRLAALAEVSRGTKSTLTFDGAMKMGWRSVRTIYEGGADRHGALIVGVERFCGNRINIYEHFARQLGQGEPNPVPPALHIVNCSYYVSFRLYVCNMSALFRRLHEHLPDTEEILVEDISSGFIERAFGALFPSDHSSQLFPKLSTLIIRNSKHEQWTYCLQRWQQGQANWGGVNPWPLQTLKIERGTISAEMVGILEKVVQNLVLDRAEIE